MTTKSPLAEELRPQNLKDVIGQAHIIGKGEVVHHIVTHKKPVSLLLWGPPGTGKTTIARIIAQQHCGVPLCFRAMHNFLLKTQRHPPVLSDWSGIFQQNPVQIS